MLKNRRLRYLSKLLESEFTAVYQSESVSEPVEKPTLYLLILSYFLRFSESELMVLCHLECPSSSLVMHTRKAWVFIVYCENRGSAFTKVAVLSFHLPNLQHHWKSSALFPPNEDSALSNHYFCNQVFRECAMSELKLGLTNIQVQQHHHADENSQRQQQ